jgi:hypothetical protein
MQTIIETIDDHRIELYTGIAGKRRIIAIRVYVLIDGTDEAELDATIIVDTPPGPDAIDLDYAFDGIDLTDHQLTIVLKFLDFHVPFLEL